MTLQDELDAIAAKVRDLEREAVRATAGKSTTETREVLGRFRGEFERLAKMKKRAIKAWEGRGNGR